MEIPCRQCINPKACLYRCGVTYRDDPDCFNCVVYLTLEDKEATIEAYKNEALEYKDKADKYDEILKAYTEGLVKTIAKTFLNTLGK